MFGFLDVEALLYTIPAILIAITIHEFSHAAAAYALGDNTAKAEGRLSLNPLVHLDPLGTLMILFTAVAGFGIGWGKPVPVNPYRLRLGSRTGMAIVSAAGPLSNLLTAFLLVLPVRADLFGYGSGPVGSLVIALVLLSIGLAVFNLLPLPPLDGFAVALGILPPDLARGLARLGQYGPGVLLLILVADSWLRLGILATLMRPLYSLAQAIVFGEPLF